MTRKEKLFAIVLAVLVAMAVVALLWRAGIACSVPRYRNSLKIGDAAGCYEFWINRYQTTIQTAASILLGGAGLYFVLKQLHGLREQNLLTGKALEATLREQQASAARAIGQASVSVTRFSGAAAALLVASHNLLNGELSPFPETEKLKIDEAAKTLPDLYPGLQTLGLVERWRELHNNFGDLSAYIVMRSAGFTVAEVEQASDERSMPSDDADAHTRCMGLVMDIMALGRELRI